MTTGLRIDRIARRVSDLTRSGTFYGAIGFRPDGAPEPLRSDLAAALGLGPGALRLPMRIGRQRLDLVGFPDRSADSLGPPRPDILTKNAPPDPLMLRCRPQAGLEARTTVMRPSRPRFAGHLRMTNADLSKAGSEAEGRGPVRELDPRTDNRDASFEADLRSAPQDEEGGAWPRRGPAANDPAFQHFAIPVRAMDRAMAALAAVAPEPISRGGAQLLPASSGGVTAFKFRDPDGHPLEILFFPSGDAAERWAEAPGLFLGIDHTAVTVSSIEDALAFFESECGFRLASRGLNRGPEQARLDGLADPVVDVLALAPPGGATPHLELLHYREPAPRTALPRRPAATWTILSAGSAGAGEFSLRRLDAPDGHGVLAETI